MGCVKNIGFDEFPKQGTLLGKIVKVCFNYDSKKDIKGVVVRDDAEEPFKMIISLVDGRHILSTECQYSFDSRD